MAKRKLGRGLDMLIARREKEEGAEVLRLDPGTIETNPDQPRHRFSLGEMETLKASVEREGVLQPLLVRRVGEAYQLIAGERRLRVAKELGQPTVPVIVMDVSDDRLLEIALIENIHRESLNPIELANAYRQLMEVKGWTQEELAENLGMSRSGVANTVRLLELPEDIQSALARGQVHMGHAKVLVSVDDEKDQRMLFERIAEEKLSVRDLEAIRDAEVEEAPAANKKGRRRSRNSRASKKPYLVSLEEELTEAVGSRVRIRERGGKGVVSVEFYSKEDFERLRALLLRS